ncbi:hypothetical protein EDD21DRAFT_428020 [Dissophora ornata]|nr:hypothetical protein EDD21DRAFT_428020 [Dissophora ornata]
MSLHTSKTENMSANLFRRAKTPSASNIPEKLPSLVGKIASWCRSFHDSKKKEFENNQCRRSYTQNAHLCPEGSLYTEHYGGMMRHEQSDGSSSENSLVASSISSRSLSFRTVDDAQEEEDDDDSKEDNNNICPSGLQEENREGNRSSWTLVTYLRATKLKITQELIWVTVLCRFSLSQLQDDRTERIPPTAVSTRQLTVVRDKANRAGKLVGTRCVRNFNHDNVPKCAPEAFATDSLQGSK